MTDPADYIAQLKTALLISEAIADYAVLNARVNTDDGYFRIRATLSNGDFFEAAEYFEVVDAQVITIDYRYQWMDGTQACLRRRWDNTPHHPELSQFPHHCHITREDNVVPSEPLSILDILAVLEAELAAK